MIDPKAERFGCRCAQKCRRLVDLKFGVFLEALGVLKKIENGQIRWFEGSVLVTGQVSSRESWRVTTWEGPMAAVKSRRKFQEFLEAHTSTPAFLGETMFTHRFAWMYKDEFFETADSLTPDDVKALVDARDLKRAKQLERAHAIVARANTATGGGTRAPIPDDVKMFVWKRDEGRCIKCDSNENLEFDHIIPIAMGGANSARNLQLLCEPCNREKGGGL